MKTSKRILLTLALMMSFTVAMAKDIQNVCFKVEQMECHNCANKVKKNIRFEKGVKMIETDVENRIVTITYDADKTDIKRLADGFEKIDYTATPVTDCNIPADKCKGKSCCNK